MSEVAAGGDHTWVFEAIGTRWVLTTAHALSQTQRLRVARLIEDYDRTFSRFREDSVVTRMSHAAGTFELPECAGPLLETYRRLDELTCGAVIPWSVPPWSTWATAPTAACVHCPGTCRRRSGRRSAPGTGGA